MYLLLLAGCLNETENTELERAQTGVVAAYDSREIELDSVHRIKRQPFFGDLHVHTSYSLDGYIIFNRTFVNVLLKVFKAEKPQRLSICGENGEDCVVASRTRWKDIQEIANEFNAPGEFTTFIGYEWTGQQGGNRHRNVIFRNDEVPATPWSMIEVPTVEELWLKLDEECLPPCDVLTISHNSNQSRGLRFAGVNPDGSPFTAEQARYRAEHEPLVEIMQFKGESECRFGLDTEDEFCNFEKYDLRPMCPAKGEFDDPEGSPLECAPECDAKGQPKGCAWARDYTRNALKIGLGFEEKIGANPYKFGVLGSTDTHNANPGNTTESNYQGNFGYLDANIEDRQLMALKTGFKQLPRNSGALAGVWAESNTRESIYSALKRRETFGTSGTRILIRFFGGWNLPEVLEADTDLDKIAYEFAVPMGADLPKSETKEAPRFLIWAAKAVDGNTLERAQVIKGWIENGKSQEQVYDVLCAGGMEPDPHSLRCPDNGARVDLSDCFVEDGKGAIELKGVWQDQNFKPEQRAFYYARVLENPVCRWSTHDAIRLGRLPPPQSPPVIQERAWSSPIWYRP